MHVKLTSGQPDQFPYTIGQFRRDNSGTSFPKNIPDTILRRWGVYPVEELPKPDYNPLVQTLVRDAMPHKEVIRLKTEEDATDPITGEVDQDQVGQPIHGNRWFVGHTVENKPQNVAATAVRNKRDSLIAATDYFALTDVTMDAAMTTYRQALRDITNHVNFPYLNEADWPTKP